jgi:hypothetical protein
MGTTMMNSDPMLKFGKHISEQIDGLLDIYSECDGVFLDQACYNFQDTAHDDGMSAYENKPCYMEGLNYSPHLEHLSALIHPDKAIIANAPYSIGMMKYIDGFMAEGSSWLCDQYQYYSVEKPMFFLCYNASPRDIEMMFQNCLLYGAGYTSYPKALTSKYLYKAYVPLLEKLFRRKWCFDANIISLPEGYSGNVFLGENNNLFLSIVNKMSAYKNPTNIKTHFAVNTKSAGAVKKISVYEPGKPAKNVQFHKSTDAIEFAIQGSCAALLAEMHIK